MFKNIRDKKTGFDSATEPPWLRAACSLSSYASTATSDSSHKQQDDHDQEDQSDAATGIGPPALAVAPGRQGADKQENQDDNQNSSHGIPLSSFFRLI